MRAMWKGGLQFGLVMILVRIYLAVDPPESGANLLHAECLTRIQSKTWCPKCGEIGRADTVRGWQVAPDAWVTPTPDELDNLPVKTLHTIEVVQFIDRREAQAALRFPRSTYYLEPEELGRHGFALLCASMRKAAVTALVKITIREREHLAIVEPFERTLLLTTVAWPTEVRSASDLNLPDETFTTAERRMAETLITAMRAPLELAAHHDAYREALDALIATKAAGGEVVEHREAPGPVLRDLMAALEASVAAARARATPGEEPKPVRKRKAAA